MPWKADAARRVLLVLLLLCATASAQTPSFDFVHGHAHSAEHCCGLCHAGPLPVLHGPLTATLVPELPVGWLHAAEESRSAVEILISEGCSRAPPLC